MSDKKRIIFTGGGSGGHVVPALTLINRLKDQYEIIYFGSETGIESRLTQGHVDRYISISTGKLRRYISFQNLLDIFKVFWGLIQSFIQLVSLRHKQMVVFSMGGFVSVPVVIAAKLIGIRVIIHEQTTRVGLANKIASKFAHKVFVSFKDSLEYFPKEKVEFSGYPVREEFYLNDLTIKSCHGINLEQLKKPLLFITGGGNGAKLLNDKIAENLSWLTEEYIIIHQVGQQFLDDYLKLKNDNYIPLAFLGNEMPDICKSASVIISRSGAGTVAELMALKKKSIFVPLKIAQKNEQYHNAMAAHEMLGSLVVEEDKFNSCDLKELIKELEAIDKMPLEESVESNPTSMIIDYISKCY